MFISHLPGDDPLFTVPDSGEITQDCAVTSVDPTAPDLNSDACKILGTFDAEEYERESIISKDVTGLPEDITVRIFNDGLREGFVKYRGQDLNFEDFNQCLTTLDGSLDFTVEFQRCEFDCP